LKESERIAERLAKDEVVGDLLAEAVRRAVEHRRKIGLEIVVWQEGEVTWKQAETKSGSAEN
jgi:hypothetical protein